MLLKILLVASEPLVLWMVGFGTAIVLAVVTRVGWRRVRVAGAAGGPLRATRRDALCHGAAIEINPTDATPPCMRPRSTARSAASGNVASLPWRGGHCGTTRPPGCTCLILASAAGKICGLLPHAPRLLCMPVPTTRPMSPALRQLEGGLSRLGPDARRRQLPVVT